MAIDEVTLLMKSVCESHLFLIKDTSSIVELFKMEMILKLSRIKLVLHRQEV